jgi:predicted transcriptional regulator
MSKAVLISIQPKWCELIASGKKIVEVRKTKPKLETPFKVYIYQTRKPVAVSLSGTGRHISEYDKTLYYTKRSGKVIGEFVCDQIDEIGYSPEMHGKYISDIDDIHYVSCLDFEQMFDYIADGYGYAWHISDLVIYDEPIELGEFYTVVEDADCGLCRYYDTPYDREPCNQCQGGRKYLERPPQSWCYVEERSRQ